MSYVGLMLKFFIANFKMKEGQVQEAVQIADQLLGGELQTYFEHGESELVIDMTMVKINYKFELFTQIETRQITTREQLIDFRKQKQEIMDLAKDCEQKIIAVQGTDSEKLAEVYCLYSFFAYQEQNFDTGSSY